MLARVCVGGAACKCRLGALDTCDLCAQLARSWCWQLRASASLTTNAEAHQRSIMAAVKYIPGQVCLQATLASTALTLMSSPYGTNFIMHERHVIL